MPHQYKEGYNVYMQKYMRDYRKRQKQKQKDNENKVEIWRHMWAFELSRRVHAEHKLTEIQTLFNINPKFEVV